jgi:hypothetical protein
MNCSIWDLLKLIWSALIGRFRSSSSLQVENLALRHQLNVLRRKSRKTFLLNHADGIASIDLLVVPTLSFRLLYGFWFSDTIADVSCGSASQPHPTSEWIARQVTEAFECETAPSYLIRDRDGVYGEAFIRHLQAMGIRDKSIAPHSPWQMAIPNVWSAQSDANASTT